MNIDDILYQMKITGSSFEKEKLKKIKLELQKYIDKDYSNEEIINIISYELKDKTEAFLYDEHKIISGINASIFVNPNYILNVIGGSKSRKEFQAISEDTLFDIASITKLYTGLLVMKLEDLDLINLKKPIIDITNSFKLDNYTIEDLINMRGIILTPKRIANCNNTKEALEVLKQIYIENSDKDIYNYTDMGLIILGYMLEEILDMDYNTIFTKYLKEPLSLRATYFPNSNITGNGKQNQKPNDPKATILNQPIASAGLFTNSLDLINLSRHLFSFDYLSWDYLKKFCFYRTEKPKGIFGSYTHHPLGLKKTYVPNEYSKYSFAYEGFTGSVVVFDLINQIHNNILVNAIYDNTLLKSPTFNQAFAIYQQDITEISLKLLVIDRYFEDNQSFVKKIKI